MLTSICTVKIDNNFYLKFNFDGRTYTTAISEPAYKALKEEGRKIETVEGTGIWHELQNEVK